jgi:hypothetical protein
MTSQEFHRPPISLGVVPSVPLSPHSGSPTATARFLYSNLRTPVFRLAADSIMVPAEQPEVAPQLPFWGDVSYLTRCVAALLFRMLAEERFWSGLGSSHHAFSDCSSSQVGLKTASSSLRLTIFAIASSLIPSRFSYSSSAPSSRRS